jgi:hypothetical protein
MLLIDNVRIVNVKGAPQAAKGVDDEASSSVKPDYKRRFPRHAAAEAPAWFGDMRGIVEGIE